MYTDLSTYCRLHIVSQRCAYASTCHVSALYLQLQQEATGADSDEDWSTGTRKGKKGKAAAAGKGKGGKAGGGGSSSAAGGKQQQKGGPDLNCVLSVGMLAQEVLKLYPDMDDAGELVWLCAQCLAYPPPRRVGLRGFRAAGWTAGGTMRSLSAVSDRSHL
jgi:hypothetical protein